MTKSVMLTLQTRRHAEDVRQKQNIIQRYSQHGTVVQRKRARTTVPAELLETAWRDDQLCLLANQLWQLGFHFNVHTVMMTTTSKARWLAHSPAKRYTELLFLVYSPFWMVWALGVVVPFKLYEHAGKSGYMVVGLGASLPCVILPWVLEHKADRSKPWYLKYWVKANIWIAIFSFIGNYFWTHYFYTILGAEYTFPSWRLNEVPITLYFMTHAYFCFYHALSNVVLRRTSHAVQSYHTVVQWLLLALVIFILAYITALMETVTIAHFPYYRFKDRSRMYTWGSVFYAIYFWVSFPVFFIMDEQPRKVWTVWEAARDSLASGMAVTMLLDLWRIAFTESKRQSLPWLS